MIQESRVAKRKRDQAEAHDLRSLAFADARVDLGGGHVKAAMLAIESNRSRVRFQVTCWPATMFFDAALTR